MTAGNAAHEGTVHLVDDDAVLRSALRWLLESVPLFVKTYESGDQFLAEYDGNGPACVVLDLVMPGMDGLALQAALAERKWTVPVIFLSGHGTIPDAVEALRRGASDFLEKPLDAAVLLERICTALEHDRHTRSEATEREERLRRLAGLTKREHDVARRVADGLANKVIAMELQISPRTVEVYRAQAMRKTGCASVADLVRLFLDSQAPEGGGRAHPPSTE